MDHAAGPAIPQKFSVLLKNGTLPNAPNQSTPENESDFEDATGSGRVVVCKTCRSVVADAGDRTNVEGEHNHVFFNPHGFMFEISCFRRAPGCSVQGPPVADFSWFSGFAWQIGVCSGCGTHLGWRFSSGNGSEFWGLIASMIEELDSGSDD